MLTNVKGCASDLQEWPSAHRKGCRGAQRCPAQEQDFLLPGVPEGQLSAIRTQNSRESGNEMKRRAIIVLALGLLSMLVAHALQKSDPIEKPNRFSGDEIL